MTERGDKKAWLRWPIAVVLLLLIRPQPSQAGDIYVCKGAHGEKVFQNTACPQTNQQLGHSTYSDSLARPPAPADYPSPAETTAIAPNKPSSVDGAAPNVISPSVGHGIGAPVDHSGDVTLKCTSASGHVYYEHGKCRTSLMLVGTEEHDWHADRVAGVPGATMVSPDGAVSPTGKFIPLQHADADEPIYKRVQDAGVSADPDEACKQARLAMVRDHSKAASDHETEMCSH